MTVSNVTFHGLLKVAIIFDPGKFVLLLCRGEAGNEFLKNTKPL